MSKELPTSAIIHIAGSCLGLVGTCAGIWWLNKNPLELSQNMIVALTIVFILFLAMFIMIESISHAHLEKNYGIDPLGSIEWT
jgi:hypothetical protein